MAKKPTKAILLAGGLGKRLSPLTDYTPKLLLPIKGKPILQHAIINLKKFGIKDIIISAGFRSTQIQDYFKDGHDFGVKIRYAIEEKSLGTGGAIKFAAKGIKNTFITLNADNLADFDYDSIYEAHKRNKALVTIAVFPVKDVSTFGIVVIKKERIVRFIEKPMPEEAPSDLSNAGLYIMEPDILECIPELLALLDETEEQTAAGL